MVDPGETHFLKSPDLLEGACERPFNLQSYEGEDDIVVLACHVLFSIAGVQAFEQGNKRTGFTAALTFLRNNGFEFSGPDYTQFADRIVAVIQRRMSESDRRTHGGSCVGCKRCGLAHRESLPERSANPALLTYG
jgi:death on curing protein